MAEFDYRSPADEAAKEKSLQQAQALMHILGLGVQGANEQRNIAAQGQQARQTEAEKAARQQDFLQPYLSGDKKLPQGIAGASEEGATLHGVDPMAMAYKQAMMQNQQDHATGQEAQKIQSRFDSLAKPYIEKIHAADASEDMIRQNNYKSIHAEQVMNAKAMIGQRLAQQEIGQVNNPSLIQSIQNKIAGWTNETNAPVLTADEQKLMLQLNNSSRQHAIQGLNQVHQGIIGGLKNTAPLSYRLGKTSDIADALTKYKDSLVAPPQQSEQFTSSGAPALQARQPVQDGGGLKGLLGGALQAGANALTGSSGNTMAGQPQQAPSEGIHSFVPHPMMGKTVRDKVTGQVGTIDNAGNFVPQSQ